MLFIGSSYVLDEVWRSYLEQDIESYTGYKMMMHAIGDYLDNHPQSQWQNITENTAKKYEVPLTLKPFSAIQDETNRSERKSLRKGDTFVLYHDDDVMLFHLLSDKKTLLTLGPAQMPTRPRLEAVVRVTILGALGLLILFWLWPISKDLDGLRKSALELGKGKFDTRVEPAKSNMLSSLVSIFNMMAKRIERLVDAHKELSNAVAHELRTPLARSKFALQMLESFDDPQRQAKYRGQIASDIVELEALINEMLVYAAFDSDKPQLNIKPVNMQRLVEEQIEAHDHYSGSIEFKNKAMNSEVSCDEHFISRVLTNFITNAEKYGNDIISITFAMADDKYQLIVEDNGSGVCEELKPVLFDAFSRGDESRNKETGGFGLGLAIVARIMEWHQGNAWVEDSELGGAKFVVEWPQTINVNDAL